ncbi:hypothetical protein GQ457_06G029130 [Hibiscus cannabinus]
MMHTTFYKSRQHLEHARHAVSCDWNPATEDPILSQENRFGRGKWSGRKLAGRFLFGLSLGVGVDDGVLVV